MSKPMELVIFACVHSAGRSQMAAAWFNRLAHPGLARAIAAGTAPAARVHPEVVAVMQEVDLDLSGATPCLLDAERVATASWLITMGCGEACPVAPKWVHKDDWALDDPKGRSHDDVRRIRDDIRERVTKLITQQGWGAR